MIKTAGIIGGMGSAATVDLFKKIVNHTKASKDQEHIPLIIDNNTQIPDRTDFLFGRGSNPLGSLMNSAHKLIKMGADFLVMACNTSHYFYDEIAASVDVKVINIVEETANEAAKLKINNIAILGTIGFLQHVNYMKYYIRLGINVIIPQPNEQEVINDLIYKGIKAKKQDIDISKFLSVLDKLTDDGVEYVALSCTELPIAFSDYNIKYPMIDSNLVLAKCIIAEAMR